MTEYAYDVYGNVTSLTVEAGGGERAATSYVFDGESNLLSETSPQGNTSTYEYDAEGNLTKSTDENGRVTTYSYDALGNNTGFVDDDGSTTYTFDKAGNLLSASNTAGTVAFTYDDLYRTVDVANEDGSHTSYTYDAVGNQTSITYPDGKKLAYSYDSLGMLTAITDHDGSATTYSYDAEGRKKKESHPDGSTTEYDYNNAGQMAQQKEVSKDNSTIREILYGYDDAGNLKSEQRTGVDVDRRDESVRYYYDKDNQLIKTMIEGKTTIYEYDLAGNLLSDGEYTYTYNNQNQLLTKTGNDGTTKYAYDASGNLVRKVSPDGSTEYTYNAQNKLIKGENSDGSYSEYTYNAMGARIGNVQYRHNANAEHSNADLDNGSAHMKDYLPALSDDRADWQPCWESEVGSVHENDFETVTAHFVVDYSSEANRVLQADVEGAYTARYVYDDFGARFSAEFTYADGTDRGTTNASGEYGENPASDMAVKDVKKVWFRGNLTGSSLYVVDENGDTVSHAVYDAWGAALTETATDINFTGLEGLTSFTGYAWDETLGLYYAQNRFYDAEDHRFTQSDPTEDGTNWYSYVENNPLIYTDPNGDRLVAAMDIGPGRGKTTVSTTSTKSSANSSSSNGKTSVPRNTAELTTSGAKAVSAVNTVMNGIQAGASINPAPKNPAPTPAPKPVVKQPKKRAPASPSPSRAGSTSPVKKPTATNSASKAKYAAAKQQQILSGTPDPNCRSAIVPNTKIVDDLIDIDRLKIEGTYTHGFTGSVSIGPFSIAGQIGLSIDTTGDIVWQYSYDGSIGGESDSLAPNSPIGASLREFQMVTNAPSVDNLTGMGYQIGGSVLYPGTPVSMGADIVILPDSQNNKHYYGVAVGAGLGTAKTEGHASWGETYNIGDNDHFNIFNWLNNLLHGILEG